MRLRKEFPRIGDVIFIVESHYGPLKYETRKTEQVIPRMLAQYLAKKYTTRSFREMAPYFNCHWSTIRDNVKSMQEKINKNRSLSDVAESMGVLLSNRHINGGVLYRGNNSDE